MDSCEICHREGKYKCPNCLMHYCSAPCSKKHKENKCEKMKREQINEEKTKENNHSTEQKRHKRESYPMIPDEKLKLLESSEGVKKLLTNVHLRNLLVTIDTARNKDEIMQKVMQIPIFVELADACLKVVEPEIEED